MMGWAPLHSAFRDRSLCQTATEEAHRAEGSCSLFLGHTVLNDNLDLYAFLQCAGEGFYADTGRVIVIDKMMKGFNSGYTI